MAARWAHRHTPRRIPPGNFRASQRPCSRSRLEYRPNSANATTISSRSTRPRRGASCRCWRPGLNPAQGSVPRSRFARTTSYVVRPAVKVPHWRASSGRSHWRRRIRERSRWLPDRGRRRPPGDAPRRSATIANSPLPVPTSSTDSPPRMSSSSHSSNRLVVA